ncbi:MAG TPA: GNAT family N-acetyltransferase [Cellvibrio sp.]|nr:GNAT family N-acetyltransferase [Cellvibrio sp.]
MKHELMLPPGFHLRIAESQDDQFLHALFCSARPELASLPLPVAQLEQLIRQQYEWQQKSYLGQFPDAENWIIETQSGPVGKIMLHRSASQVRIIDFIIAPDWRRRGVGSTILVAVKNFVEIGSGTLHLSVDRQNIHAKRLYVRQGFVVSQTSDTHEQLTWTPAQR